MLQYLILSCVRAVRTKWGGGFKPGLHAHIDLDTSMEEVVAEDAVNIREVLDCEFPVLLVIVATSSWTNVTLHSSTMKKLGRVVPGMKRFVGLFAWCFPKISLRRRKESASMLS